MAITREVTAVAGVAMPVGESWTVRRCRYTGQESGAGRLCIATGIHGDEVMGQLIVYGVVRRMMDHPQYLRGTVDVYPMLNPLGLDMGERMVPSGTRLDMNRSFPGAPDGTPMEHMCHAIVQDMAGADLVLDIHDGTRHKSELYEVRMHGRDEKRLMDRARSLCPEFIWVYPDLEVYKSSLTGALSLMGTNALILEADERHHHPQRVADRIVDGIFCMMKQMGLWTGDAAQAPQGEIPCAHGREEVSRITCEFPGIYVPEYSIGQTLQAGDVLGRIVDAIQGETLETIAAPCGGLVFSQRSYGVVYPGTLIARMYRQE